jgi:pantoate--beta-alanine ligase
LGEERERALALFGSLRRAQALFSAGESDAEVLRAAMRRTLEAGGVEAEYAEVVDPDTLDPLARARPGAVCMVAGQVGSTRLIDNHILEP